MLAYRVAEDGELPAMLDHKNAKGIPNRAVVLGPGGFRFGDYWRLGLALEVIVVAVSVPMLLWVWPF